MSGLRHFSELAYRLWGLNVPLETPEVWLDFQKYRVLFNVEVAFPLPLGSLESCFVFFPYKLLNCAVLCVVASVWIKGKDITTWCVGFQFGFINYEVGDSKKLFFHVKEVQDGVELQAGDEVEFSVILNQRTGKCSACNVWRVWWGFKITVLI